jgi:L-arabinonolactonase
MSGPEPILSAGIICGESPVWVPEEQALYFTDIPGREIHRFDPASGADDKWPMPEEVGCFAPRVGGGFVAALRSGFAFIDLEKGTVDYICDPESDKPENRFNDGRCDRQGRFWAGTMHEPRTSRDGVLYRLESGGTCTAMADDVLVANGLAWSPDGTVMYWSDSRRSTVFAFDFDPASGEIANRRVFIELNEEQGRPDGATVDAEGFYWSACYMGGRVMRIAPDGKIDREIMMPVRDITMVAFGGADLDRLYITTSREALSSEEFRAAPLAGSIFLADPGVRGLVDARFQG